MTGLTEDHMTDESTPTAETTTATADSVAASGAEPAAPASELHALADDLHALLTRVEGLEHEIKADLTADLQAVAAKLKAAL